MRRLLLASKSPRRRELFDALGWEYDAIDPHVDERVVDGEPPVETARRLAREKAVAGSLTCDIWTVGADTIVDLDGIGLGKPRDREDAARMLRSLSGREHLVHTGIAVACRGSLLAGDVVTTRVRFGELDDETIGSFVASGLADDKAGAYAIQGEGAVMVERIEGCFYNVVGLPVFRLNEMLRELERSGGSVAPITL